MYTSYLRVQSCSFFLSPSLLFYFFSFILFLFRIYAIFEKSGLQRVRFECDETKIVRLVLNSISLNDRQRESWKFRICRWKIETSTAPARVPVPRFTYAKRLSKRVENRTAKSKGAASNRGRTKDLYAFSSNRSPSFPSVCLLLSSTSLSL